MLTVRFRTIGTNAEMLVASGYMRISKQARSSVEQSKIGPQISRNWHQTESRRTEENTRVRLVMTKQDRRPNSRLWLKAITVAFFCHVRLYAPRKLLQCILDSLDWYVSVTEGHYAASS